MRGSLFVLAMAMSPFVTTVSKAQAPASTSSSSRPMCQWDPGNPSANGEANRTKKCPPPPPPATGKVTITGMVFFDLAPYDGIFDPDNENGIAGWTVVLIGPTGQLTYSTATDPNNPGFFSFAGLPSNATYTLCVQPAPGWTQTAPMGGASCTSSVGSSWGYTFAVPALAGDAVVSDQNFGFYSNPMH
ncbi:MAG TPA: carboxypeptidase-like regulatory domain-containing protein [Gemmatimonadaceae bacterium]|jgi:hypothetical protein